MAAFKDQAMIDATIKDMLVLLNTAQAYTKRVKRALGEVDRCNQQGISLPATAACVGLDAERVSKAMQSIEKHAARLETLLK